MASNTVAITLTVDEASALKAWTSQQAAVEKLRQKLNALKAPADPLKPIKDGAGQAVGALRDAAVQIVGIGSAVGGIVAFANRLKSEFEALKANQGNAAAANVDLAKVMPELVRSMDANFTGPQTQQFVNQGARDSGQTQERVAQVFQQTFAAVSPQTPDEARSAMDAAVKVMRSYPEQDAESQKSLAVATAYIAKQTGLKNDESLAYGQMAANLSFPAKTEFVAKNIMPALANNVGPEKFSLEKGAAVYGALSGAVADETGVLASGALTHLQRQLREKIGSIPGVGKSADEQLSYLQQHPELKEPFFKGGTIGGKKFEKGEWGEGKMLASLEEIVTPGSRVEKDLQSKFSGIGTKSDWVKKMAELTKSIDELPSVQVEKIKRAFETSANTLAVGNSAGAIASEVRTGLQKTLANLGESELSQQLNGLEFEVNTAAGTKSPIENMVGKLAGRSNELRAKSIIERIPTESGVEKFERPKTAEQIHEDTKKAETLDTLRERLIQASKDVKKAKILDQAEPQFERLRNAKAVYDDATVTPEKRTSARQEAANAEREVRGLARKYQEESPEAAKKLMEGLAPFWQESPEQMKPSKSSQGSGNGLASNKPEVMAVSDDGSLVWYAKPKQKSESAAGPAEAVKVFTQLNEAVVRLEKTLSENTKATAQNNTVTAENSRAVAPPAQAGKPQSTPSPPVARTAPVTSLQSKGKT